jgi:Transcription factor WhiB
MSFTFDRPEWQKRAACRGMDPDIFFPRRGESLEPAKAVCSRCPVFRQCKTHAIEYDEDYGVWARQGREGREKQMKAAVASGQLDPGKIGCKKAGPANL